MNDELWTRDEPASPCIKLCLMHPDTGFCIGCKRTLDEISHWSELSAQERRTILDVLPSRGARLHQRRGGRAARTRS